MIRFSALLPILSALLPISAPPPPLECVLINKHSYSNKLPRSNKRPYSNMKILQRRLSTYQRYM